MPSRRRNVFVCFLICISVSEIYTQDLYRPSSSEEQPANIWDQLVGIIRQQSNPPEYLKTYVNNKKLDAEGRDARLCEVPCENGGRCVGKDQCNCAEKWFGPTCTLFECTEPCLNGQCRGPDVCFCESGWSGISCNRPICNPSCMNRGKCVAPDECFCPDGYVGQRCQDATCDPPCGHGSCYRPNQCMCDPGWRGPLCTQPVCQPTCQNGGQCTGPNECSCTEKWRGYKCEIPVCRNRCQNGGKCVAPDECKCLPRFVGESCQIALDKEAHAGRTCTVWNSYHFRTFDGNAFDFPGLCRYELACDKRDRLFSIELIKNRDDFTHAHEHGSDVDVDTNVNDTDIVAETVRQLTGEFMAITLSIRGISQTFTLLPNNLYLFGNELVTERQFTHKGIAIEKIGRYIRVRTRVGVSILWDGEGVAEIEIENENYHGIVAGLCGNYDSDPFNDIVMKDGTAATDLLDFAMAWRVNGVHEECVDITDVPIHCSNESSDQIEDDRVTCTVLISTLPAFQHCRDSGIDPTSFTDACMTDMCKCKKANRIDCVCSALTQYSRLCTHETGIAPNWRKTELCGVTCPVGMVYTECASSCPRTCQSLVTPDTECDDHCLDGCTCKNGTVLKREDVCVAEEECPCIHGDASFATGHVIRQNCLECQCSGALWNCKNLQCDGECSVVGASHYTTFDGLLSRIYGECQFIFAKDCSGTELFSVVVENSLCSNELTEMCVSEVLVSVKPVAAGPATARTSMVEDRSGEIKILFGRRGRVTVAEQDIVLPYLNEHFQIFRASSDFVQLRLNLGITLDFDGDTRLYIRADRKWMGKMCGMCGNFNDNKRDDMLNFNGLVEKSATAFSNLWKVNADCKDATPNLNLDPCVSHPQRAEFAKDRCSMIRQPMFRKCHPFVNPGDAEMICQQDVCQCDKGDTCACNAIAHYARQCAKKGQIVNWRTETFCPVVCTGGQVYQQCGSSCQSSCRSISDERARCSEMCVEGCNCPPNLYLNEYKVCVPRTQCQCYHNGRVYQPFFILRRAFTTCHCRDGHFTCHNIENREHGLPGTNVHTNQTCKSGWIYHRCDPSEDFFDEYPRGIECQKTCRNLDTRCVATECVQGCGCPEGLVLNPDTNECIDRDECPCYLGGRSYGHGEQITVDCNTCSCERREWVCTEQLCVGTCTAYGDPHYETFDGYKFEFMGQCGYILSQDYCDNHDGRFRVYAENMQCGSSSVACTKSVTVALTETIYIKLNKDTFGYTQRPLVDWGVLPGSTTNHTDVMWDFHHVGLYTIITTDIGLTVIWDRKTTVYVKLEPSYRGRVCGLCGDFDGNQNNDMTMSDHMLGINPTEFGNSWKQSPLCHDVTERDSPCGRYPERKIWAQRSCKILYDEKFSDCHSVVDVVWYHTNCIYDACGCDGGGDCECLCTAIAAYAHACSEEGIHIRWRTPHVCPLMCEGYDEAAGDCTWHYSECESACPQTCQHRYLADGFDSCPLSLRCVEGCFPYCPEGTLYDEAAKQCVEECAGGCHANGKLYHYNQIVTRENCRICTCSEQGGIVCHSLPECEVTTEAFYKPPSTSPPEIQTTFPLYPSTEGVASTTSGVLTPPVVKRYCFGEVNLGFLVDGSHYVSTAAFEASKGIIKTLVESVLPLDYGRQNSTLKLLLGEFSDVYEDVVDFDRDQDHLSVAHKLRDMELHHGTESNIALALNEIADSYQKTSKFDKDLDFADKRSNIIVIFMFSPVTGDAVAASKRLEELRVRSLVISVDAGPDKSNIERILGHSSIVYKLEEISDFIKQQEIGMEMLEAICNGTNVPKTTEAPITTIPTEPPMTTTSTETPFQICTMIADLVVVVDVAFLTKSKPESDRFLKLLRLILSDTLVRPDRTHVTILLCDARIWRVGRFIATRDELLGDLEDTILSSIRTKVFRPKHFDLNYALEQAVDGYLMNSDSGMRVNDPRVHKSILVFQAREPYPEPLGDMNVLSKWMSKLRDGKVVINIITQKKTFSSRRDKNTWKRSIGIKNLLFADIIKKDITKTKFALIMDRVCRTPPALPMPPMYCDGRTDLYFLWDDSNNIVASDVRNMMQATKKISGSLKMENFGKDARAPLRVGIVQYSGNVNFLLNITQQKAFQYFIKSPVHGLPSWSLGQQSNLGKALSTVANDISALSSGRNTTVVIFTSRPSTDDFEQPSSKLKKSGTKIIAMGFAPDTTVRELKQLAGSGGWYRRIASTRELLDNDIGMALAYQICTPTEVPFEPTVESTSEATKTSTTSTQTPRFTGSTTMATPAACAMSADIQIILDSNLTSIGRKSELAFGVLKQLVTDLEIGDGPEQSRVGIVISGQQPSVLSDMATQGKNKHELMRLLQKPTVPKSLVHVPFSLAKTTQMTQEFVFDVNERKSESEYDRHLVLLIDRLPENELSLVREGSLESVKSSLVALVEEDIQVHIVYTEDAFKGLPEDFKKQWLADFEDQAMLLEESDNPETFGSELIDKLCVSPTTTTVTTPYQSSTTPEGTATTAVQPTYYCEHLVSDVIFLMENANTAADFDNTLESTKDFIWEVVRDFHVSADKVQIAIAQYNNRIHETGPFGFRFGELPTTDALHNAITALQWHEARENGLDLISALNEVVSKSFKRDETKVSRTVVVISSMPQNEDVNHLKNAVEVAAKSNVQVVFVTPSAGVGDIGKDLEFLKQHVIFLPSPGSGDVSEAVENTKTKICEGVLPPVMISSTATVPTTLSATTTTAVKPGIVQQESSTATTTATASKSTSETMPTNATIIRTTMPKITSASSTTKVPSLKTTFETTSKVATTSRVEPDRIHPTTSTTAEVVKTTQYEPTTSKKGLQRSSTVSEGATWPASTPPQKISPIITTRIPKIALTTPAACRLDLQLIVDSSSSLTLDFPVIKTFLKSLVQEFDVESDAVRVGIVQYSGESRTEFKLRDHVRDQRAMLTAIEEMTLLDGLTFTFHAIDHVIDDELSETDGRREDVPLTILLLTDGRIKDIELKEQVMAKMHTHHQMLSENGVNFNFMVIGFGSADEDELMSISPHVTYTGEVSQFEEDDYVNDIAHKVCFPPPVPEPPTTIQTTTTTSFPECAYMPPTDLLFILDGGMDMLDTSGSRIKQYREFLTEMTEKFALGQTDTQVGVTMYSDRVYNKKPNGFGFLNAREDLNQEITNLDIPGGFTDGVTRSLKEIFSSGFTGGRTDARDVAVVLLLNPGYAMDTGERMEDMFREVSDSGIDIVVLLGSSFPEQNMAIDFAVGPYIPDERKVSLGGGTSGLKDATDILKDLICGEMPTPVSTTSALEAATEKKTTAAITSATPTTPRVVQPRLTTKATTLASTVVTTHEVVKPKVPEVVRPETTISTSEILHTTRQPTYTHSEAEKSTEMPTTLRPLVPITTVPSDIPETGCENMPATDILFVIDGSRPPGMPSHEQVYKDFLHEATQMFTIGPNNTQIAVFTYNDDTFDRPPYGFEFDQKRTMAEIQDLINGINLPGGYLADHIRPIESILQNAFRGNTGARDEANKVAVVFLSRVDTHITHKPLSSVFENASANGTNVVVMGIPPDNDDGEMVMAILNSAGSTVFEKIAVDLGFRSLPLYAPFLQEAICGETPPPWIPTSKPPEILPTGKIPILTTVQEGVPEPEPLCMDKVNVLFIIDDAFMSSSSMIQGLLSYFMQVLDHIMVGENHVRVSVATVGERWVTKIDFNNQTKDVLLRNLEAIFSHPGAAEKLPEFNTDIAFGNATNILKSQSKPSDSSIVLLLRTPPVTLSHSRQKELIDSGIVVSVVALDDGVGSAARSLASQRRLYLPSQSNWQMVQSGASAQHAICTERPGSYIPPPKSPCPDMAVDVMMAINNVHLRGEESILKKKMVDLVKILQIGKKVRVASVSYGTNATIQFGLDTYSTKDDIIGALNYMTHSSSANDSNMYNALRYIAEHDVLFKARPSVPRYILNIAGHSDDETGDIDGDIFEVLTSKDIATITIGPDGHIWPNATIIPKMPSKLTNISNEGFSSLLDGVVTLLCAGYPMPATTAPPVTTAVTPVLPQCQMASDTLFILDVATLNNRSSAEYVQQYFSEIEDNVAISDLHTRVALMSTKPGLDVWKQFDDFEHSLEDTVLTQTTHLEDTTIAVNITQVLKNAIEVFKASGERANIKRNVVLILAQNVQGAITNTLWDKLRNLGVTLVTNTINTKFLRANSVDKVPYANIPAMSLRYLPNAADATIKKICEAEKEPEPVIPVTPTPPTQPPDLVCPPGDVVMMYDSMLLTADTESKMKKFLKNLAKLLENTYSPTKTKFALVSFGSDPELQFGLGSLKTMPQIARAIDESQHYGSDTPLNAGRALSYVLNDVITTQGSDASNITKTIFILLSRRSFDSLADVMQSAVGVADIITFVIGYEHDYIDRLTTVKYGGVHVTSFDKARNLEYETLELICSAVPTEVTTAPPVIVPEIPSLPCKVDLMFILDEQLMDSSTTLGHAKSYLNLVAKYLTFGEDFFNVGAMQLSTESVPLVIGGFSNNREHFQDEMEASMSVTPTTGGLDLVSGINSAMREFEQHGRTSNGDDLARVIVFLLRRRPSQIPDKARLQRLRDNGAIVMSVVMDDALSVSRSSLTNYNRGYIRAYRPSYLRAFVTPIVYFLNHMVCQKLEGTTLPPATAEPTTPLIPITPAPVCSRTMDITYVVDKNLLHESYSGEIVKSFMKDTLRKLDLGADKTRFSVLSFLSTPELIIDLHDAYDRREAFENIDERISTGGASATDSESNLVPALYYAANHVLKSVGVRDAEKVIVVLHSGKTGDGHKDLRNAVTVLQYMNTKIIYVSQSAADAGHTTFGQTGAKFTFKNVDQLPSLVPDVTNILCGKDETTTKPSTTGVKLPASTTTPHVVARTTPFTGKAVSTTKEETTSLSPELITEPSSVKTLSTTEQPKLTATHPDIATSVTQIPVLTHVTRQPHVPAVTTTQILKETKRTEIPEVPATSRAKPTVAVTSPEASTRKEEVIETTTTEGFDVEVVTPTPYQPQVVDCATLKLDLLILLQASNYLAKFGSEHMKTFAQKLAMRFKIGQNNVLTSVRQFDDDIVSDSSHMDGFSFDYVPVPQVMRDAMFQLHIEPGEDSDPARALNDAIENYLTAATGARDDVRKAVLMVMEAPPRNESFYQFNQAIREAVKKHISIFVLYIPKQTAALDGAIEALSRINQLPQKNKVVARNGFNDLADKDFIEELGEEICQDYPRLLPVVTTTRRPTSTTKMATVASSTSEPIDRSVAPVSQPTTAMPTGTEVTTRITGVWCTYASDLMLVVDTSDLSETKLNILKRFLSDLIEKFEIGQEETRVAVISYGTLPETIYRFADTQSFALVQQSITNMPKSGKYTNTGAALKMAEEEIRSAGRDNMPWTVLLITDARSKDELISAEDIGTLKSRGPGVTLAAVGIQAAPQQQLAQFADDGAVVTVDTYQNLLQNITLSSVYNLLCPTVKEYTAPEIATEPGLWTTTTLPPGPTTVRFTSITSSTTSYTELCDCYWTDSISRDSPTPDKPGDDESWASYGSDFGGVCRDGYQGFDIHCQSSGGYIQNNVKCSNKNAPACYAYQVTVETGCFDYSVSVRCCSSVCERTTVPPIVEKEPFCNDPMDLVYVVDTTQSKQWLTATKIFLDRLLDEMEYGNSNTRSSLVTYGSQGAQVASDWTVHKKAWKSSIDNIKPSTPGLANVAGALGIVHDMLASKTRVMSDGREPIKTIIVVQSGSAVGTVDAVVQQLKHDGYQLMTVGVEEPRESLMHRLSTDQQSIFTPGTIEEFVNETATRVLERLCGEEEIITTTEVPTTPTELQTLAVTSQAVIGTAPQQRSTVAPTEFTVIAEVTEKFVNATSKRVATPATSTMSSQAVTGTAQQQRSTVAPTGFTVIAEVTEKFVNATSKRVETPTTSTMSTTKIPVTTKETATEPIISTTTSATTTTPVPLCSYYNKTTSTAVMLEYGETIYPDASDKCTTLRCVENSELMLEDKRKICPTLPKPTCKNGIEPVLHYDSFCNCQWDCQCYCQVSGVTHHTFDGAVYPVGEECNFILSKSTHRAKRSGREYIVKYRRNVCEDKTQLCITEVMIKRLNNTLRLFRNYTVLLNSSPITSSSGDIDLMIIGKAKIAVKLNDIGLELEYEPGTNGITLSLFPYLWYEDTEGLCGGCNNDLNDDFTLRNKSRTENISDFVEDWSIGTECTDHKVECNKTTDHCELIKSGHMFEECRDHLNWSSYYNSCLDEVCRDSHLACLKLAGFAEACRHVGLCVEWRSPDLCPHDCDDGRLFMPCVEPPYDMSCPSEETAAIPKSGVDKYVEGCFYNCSRTEVVIHDTCVPQYRCQQCYDEESSSFKEPGEIWVPEGRPCDICTCKEDRTIRCEERSCVDTKTPPRCKACEKLALKPNTDSCCPEYECVCDYATCEPAVPSKPCQNGEVLQLASNGTCQPSYECICDLNRCVIPVLYCEHPMVAQRIKSPCCPKAECRCPETCLPDYTTCEMGLRKVTHYDICNCSSITCEPMPVCVVHTDDRTILKTPGEEWIQPNDECSLCRCENTTGSNYTEAYTPICRNQDSLCVSCEEGYTALHVKGECCPHCEPSGCIYNDDLSATIVRQVGETWQRDSDKCRNYTCTLVKNIPVILEVTSHCSRPSPDACGFGYNVKCNNDPCCPDCQCVPQDVCLLNDTALQKPGNTWIIDVCTSCECTHDRQEDGFYSPACTTEFCPGCGDDSVLRMTEGKCCGECVPTTCLLEIGNETTHLGMGAELRHGCNITRCVRDGDGYALSVTSPVSCAKFDEDECVHLGGSVTLDETGCCNKCEFQHRQCQVHIGQPVELTVGDCTSKENIVFTYCQGECTSGTHFDASTGQFLHHCSCCKPTSYENRTQDAACTNGTDALLSYRFISECSCERVACTEWTKITTDSDVVSYAISPKFTSHQHETTSVVTSWVMDNSLKVVEITNLDQREPNVAGVVQETINDYGLSHLAVQSVHVSARNSSLSESLKKAIAATTTRKRASVTTGHSP